MFDKALKRAMAFRHPASEMFRLRQLDVNGSLRGDDRGATQGLRGKRLSVVLVAGQMTLAIVLLSDAGVLVRSLLNVVDAKSGVRDPAHLLIGSVRLLSVTYPSPAARLRYFERLEARLRTISGIDDGAVASAIPVDSGRAQSIEIEGRAGPSDAEEPVQFVTVGARYFQVVGAAATSGREFTDHDGMAGLPVAIVNQAFAVAFWPDGQPLGQRLRALDRNHTPGEWRVVVGVVPNIMQGDATRQRFKPLVYVPLRQDPPARASFLLRTSMPSQVAQPVRVGGRERCLTAGQEIVGSKPAVPTSFDF